MGALSTENKQQDTLMICGIIIHFYSKQNFILSYLNPSNRLPNFLQKMPPRG
jgi:uncharacterized membrane protein YwzB